jgi:tetratricopeptide (TPR) repeat protein
MRLFLGIERDFAIRLLIEKKGTLWQPKSNLAPIMLNLGFVEEAATLIRSAIASGDKSAGTYTMLASCQIEDKKYDDAMLEVTRALAMDPRFAPAIGTKGLIAEGTGQLVTIRGDDLANEDIMSWEVNYLAKSAFHIHRALGNHRWVL